ncbi:BNR/Asp-box repeat-containing protein [Paramicrobacterium humi]|uniref:BNR/Asp-box repeat-containing protein n=1 Tax=Paramicrobacterium humi TaxID=640635 RepID=A0A1H4K540_9MICO|nr:hypothetical protein [Microbacterium humi]SEB53208.1 BNR/Asp-box repeat-containing protein [Microbacterium humi]
MTRLLRTAMAASTCAGVILTLAACSTTQPHDAPAAASELAHIHALSESTEGALLVASHNGIYEVTTGEAAEIAGPIGEIAFDSMGFVAAGDTWYTSGHPGESSPRDFAAPNLGLLKSEDRGKNWTRVSLAGEVDFHSLTASPADSKRLYGIRTDSQEIQISTDGGVSWKPGASLVARALVADNNPDIVYATTENGLAISSDAGATFSIATDAPPLFLLAADPTRGGSLVGIDTSGTVWEQQSDRDWVSGGTIDGIAQALTVTSKGSLVLALEHGIVTSDDLGETWSTIVDIG